MAQERKDTVDSLINTRNGIAHGDDTGITFAHVSDYRDRVFEIVDKIHDLAGV